MLILVGHDRMFVSKSRYIASTIKVDTTEAAMTKLRELSTKFNGAYIICSNDKAAEMLDRHETEFSKTYRTPMRGKAIGNLFTKNAQCDLARQCGVTVPESIIYNRGEIIPALDYPVLIKPNDSNRGEKADIHICRNQQELEDSLSNDSQCDQFIVQQFINKEYEINLIGAANDHSVAIPGGIIKLRHYPSPNGPCSFGVYLPIRKLPVDITPIKRFVEATGYHGPFSVELLHSGDKNYFMEMNFRHDGLAYTATAAGVNLLDFYVNNRKELRGKVRKTYMMDISIDPLHIRDGKITRKQWLRDILHTDCQLNFNLRDPMPTIAYYKAKFMR